MRAGSEWERADTAHSYARVSGYLLANAVILLNSDSYIYTAVVVVCAVTPGERWHGPVKTTTQQRRVEEWPVCHSYVSGTKTVETACKPLRRENGTGRRWQHGEQQHRAPRAVRMRVRDACPTRHQTSLAVTSQILDPLAIT